MINFLKKWHGKIGGLDIEQSAVPCDDGEQLHVMTMFRPGGDINVRGSRIPFAEIEKLADDAFRMELARQHIADRLAELRKTLAATEAALAVQP